MKICIKDSKGIEASIDPKDITVNGKTLESIVSDLASFRKELDRHRQEEAANAMEARNLWQSIKK